MNANAFSISKTSLIMGILAMILLTGGAYAEFKPISAIPASTTFLIRIDVKQLASLNIYKQIEAERDQDPKAKALYEKFVNSTGVKLEEDVDHVFVSLIGSAGPGSDAISLVTGKFDEKKIITYGTNKENNEGKEVKETEYNGVKIYNVPGDKDEQESFFSILSPQLLVFGTEGGIRLAIDAEKGKAKGIATSEEIMALAQKVKSDSLIWGVGQLPKAVATAPSVGPTQALKTLKTLSFSVDYSPNLDITITGDCEEEKEAVEVKNSISQALGMAMIFGAQMGLSDIIQKLQISNAAKSVILKLSLTPEEIALLKAKIDEFKSQGAAMPMGGGF